MEDNKNTPEYLQKKLYFLLDQLKSMHEELPEKYQMRIPYELLTLLANTLLNETLYEIVKGLMEIQHVTEKHLQQLRDQVETEYQMEVKEWMNKIHDPDELDHIFALTKIKHTNNLRDTDKRIIAHIDQKVVDQQSTLEKAGVPGFYITENPKEVKIQMHLLDFILRLSRVKYP